MPMIQERGCTLLGISISGLADAPTEQLELPLFDRDEGEPRMDAALDAVRERFGKASVTRGALLTRRLGHEMPTLPDAPDPPDAAISSAGG